MGHIGTNTKSGLPVDDVYGYVHNILNRGLVDSGQPFVPKRTFIVNGAIHPEFLKVLFELQDRGVLRILGSIDSIEDDLRFVKMLQFVDCPRNPKPNYVKWDME